MKKIDFENGTILANILGTAFPMMLAQLISLLYNIVDRIYIGRIPGTGTTALGAVGLCFPIIIMVSAFTNMFGIGGSPLFSIFLGKKQPEKACAVLNTSFRLEVLGGITLTLLGELFAGQILTLFGAGPKELIYSLPYIRLYLIGTLFTMLATGMNPYLNAQGYAVIGMFSVLIGAVTNIVLDPLFIFIFGMGINGAAIATVISQFLSMLFVLRFLLGPKNEYKLVPPSRYPLSESKQRLPYWKDIVSLGTSPFVMQATNALVSISCNHVLLITGGSVYVSVMTIISSIRQILDTPIHAITEGSTPTLSYNYGARRPAKLKKAMAIMSAMAIGYTVFIWFAIEKLPLFFVSIFTEDTQLQNMALYPLHLYFYAFIFQALQYSGQTIFKALNKRKKAIFFSLFRKVIMVVPLTYALPLLYGMGSNGVFIAEPISNLIGGLVCFSTMLFTVLPELKQMP